MVLINSDNIDDIVIHSGNILDVDLYPLAVGSLDAKYTIDHRLVSNTSNPIYITGPQFSISSNPPSDTSMIIGVIQPEIGKSIYLAAVSVSYMHNRLSTTKYVDVPDLVLNNMNNTDIYVVTADRIIPVSFDRAIPSLDVIVIKPRPNY